MLVHQVRKTAGVAMHDAWNAPPAETDDAMNIPPDIIDLSSLTPDEHAYIKAFEHTCGSWSHGGPQRPHRTPDLLEPNSRGHTRCC